MQLKVELHELLNKLGLKYTGTIADRRGTIVLRVTRDGAPLILKLHSDSEDEDSRRKEKLLIRESEILTQIPQLTNRLYVEHGTNNKTHWLLIREIDGQLVHLVAKKARETISDQKELTSYLIELLLKVSAFYSTLYCGGYLHGDVQPAHTYLEHGQITIIDWGLSSKLSKPDPMYNGGFIYYVAPEIALQMQLKDAIIKYTPQAEVYALGAVLFMIYTGSLALNFDVAMADIQNVSMENKLRKVIENSIFTFRELKAEPYPSLEECLRRCLSTKPMDRFESPSVLYSHLLELKKHE